MEPAALNPRAPLFYSCVTVGKLLILSRPQFLPNKMRNRSTCESISWAAVVHGRFTIPITISLCTNIYRRKIREHNH